MANTHIHKRRLFVEPVILRGSIFVQVQQHISFRISEIGDGSYVCYIDSIKSMRI